MNIENIKQEFEDNRHIINLTSSRKLAELGCALRLNQSSRVLDLCCGYGTTLKLWGEAFGISGIGVDRCEDFIRIGRGRISNACADDVTLICGDVLDYSDNAKYDVVCCTETLGDEASTLSLMEKFLEPQGKLVFYKVFSEIPDPPKELTDFEGELKTLDELYVIFRSLGYYITYMSTGEHADWERYITRDAQINLEAFRRNPDEKREQWNNKWFHMYFKYRRPYEGQAIFVLERL